MENNEIRRQAIEWWDSLDSAFKVKFCFEYNKSNQLPLDRRWGNLTGREIQEIYNKEVLEAKTPTTQPLTKEEVINWLIDAHVMIGEINDEGKDEGKCLLGQLIEILKSEAGYEHDAVVGEAKNIWDSGEKITAVKYLKTKKGWSLKQAADFCRDNFGL